MPVIGSRELLIKPVFTGGAAAISRQLGGIATQTGAAAGRSLGAGVSNGYSEAAAKLKAEVTALEKSMAKSQATITSSQAKIVTSTEAEAKAIAAVKVAELKLQETRDNSRAKASQIAAAEAKLEEARRKATRTTGDRKAAEETLARATAELSSAQGKSATTSDELEKALKKAGNSAEGSKKQLGSLGDAIGKFAKGGAVAIGAQVVAVGAAMTKGVIDSLNIEDGVSKLEVRLGLTKDQAAVAGKASGAVYAQNFGGSMEEVEAGTEAVISSIKGMRDASQADVEDMTKRMLTLSDVMELDVTRASQVAGQMVTTGLAKDGVEAADLLLVAMQKVPAALREDVLDAVDEYGPFFKNLGYSGEQAMGLLVNASQKGMFGVDKTGDALKEFSIRATDMSKASGDAYKSLGLDQDEMTGKLLAGGEAASGAYNDIVAGLLGIEDPAAQSAAALALFGTPLEDLSVTEIPQFLDSMLFAEGSLGDVAGASTQAMDTLASTSSAGFASFKRQAMGSLIKFVQDNIMPTVSGFATFLANDAGPKLSSFLDLLSGAGSILFQGDFKGSGLMGIEEDHPLVGFLFSVREGFMGVADYITGTALPAIRGFGQWVADNKDPILTLVSALTAGALAFKAYLIINQVIASTQVFLGVMKAFTVATTLATAKQWLLNTALFANPIGLVIAAVTALVAGLVWFFTQTELGQQIVKNVWGAIQSFIGGTVTWFQTYVLPTILTVFNAVGAVFSWLWSNIISPVFGFISGAATALGMLLGFVFQIIVAVIQRVVGPAIQALYNVFVKPVFDAIGAVVSAWWNYIVMPIFNSVVGFIHNVLGPVFSTLYNVYVKPIFDGIGNSIKWVWDNVIKPVFDALSNFVRTDIPNAFKSGISLVETFWNGLKKILSTPIQAGIDIINNGLIGGLNNIGGLLGIKNKLPTIPNLPGFTEGGILAGTSSWRDGDSQLVPMRPGEGVYVSEVMQDPYERARLFAMNQAGMKGNSLASVRAAIGEGFAKGGIFSPLKNLSVTQGYNRVHKGIDYAASVGTPVFATQDGVVTHSGPGARAPGVWGGNEVHVLGNGIETWFAHLSSMAVRVGDMVKAGMQIANSGNTGISSGPHLHFGAFSGGWPNDIDPTAYLGGAGVPQGGSPNGGVWNPLGGIVDGILDKLKDAFPAAGFIADFALGVFKKFGGSVIDLFTGGNQDKNVAGSAVGPSYLYDNGGVLNPGLTQVLNNSRKPEAIYTNSQNSALQALAARGAAAGGGINFNGPIHVRDEQELARVMRTSERDAQAMYAF